MNVDEFTKGFCDLLLSMSLLSIKIENPIKISGDTIDLVKVELQEVESTDSASIHKAGVYVICSYDEALYIGEGGVGKSENSGNMGHRVYQHLKSKEWKNEIRQIFYIAIYPGEFSRLGEQVAFALHYTKTGKLPKYQNEWR